MAFGKADTGLIQADRAAREMDPMLGVSAGIGNFLGGLNKSYQANQAAIAKANVDLDKEWSKITSEAMNSNNDLTRAGRMAQKKLYREGKKAFANAKDGAERDEIADYYNKKINSNGFIASGQKQSQDNGNSWGPGFDDTDKYFSTMFSGDRYETEEVNGQSMVKIKNPPGYTGGQNGYTYFDQANLPISMDQWTDGSTSILGVWNEQYGGRTNWEEKMLPGNFAEKYKASFPKKMNYFQAQDLIAADHSQDGKDNSFLNEFTSGNLPSSYYSDINTTDGSTNYITVQRRVNEAKQGPLNKGEIRDKDKDGMPVGVDAEGEPGAGKVIDVTFDPNATLPNGEKDPMGGLTKEELTGYIKGLDSNGVKDYRNQSKLNEFIKEKYSTFMGDVTSEAYNVKQKEELIKNRRYFNMPNEDGTFSMMGDLSGKFPTAKEVTTEKKTVLQNMKFDSAVSANIMTGTGDNISKDGVTDWNKFTDWENALDPDTGDLLANLKSNYNYADVVFSSNSKGDLVVQVGDAEETYPFGDKNKDKNALMQDLKEQLNMSNFDNYNELTTLGDDASTWMKTISGQNKEVIQNLSETDMLPEDDRIEEVVMQGNASEQDALKMLSKKVSSRGDTDKITFNTKQEYKDWYMNLPSSKKNKRVAEIRFKQEWEALNIKS